MTDVRLITSFNEDILKTTASHLIQSIKDNVEPSVKLSAYHHDCKLDAYSIPDTISYKNLEDFIRKIWIGRSDQYSQLRALGKTDKENTLRKKIRQLGITVVKNLK